MLLSFLEVLPEICIVGIFVYDDSSLAFRALICAGKSGGEMKLSLRIPGFFVLNI